MPRSRSSGSLSRNCSTFSRALIAPVTSRMRSARVLFPWSTCAMIEKLRIFLGSVGIGRSRGGSLARAWRADQPRTDVPRPALELLLGGGPGGGALGQAHLPRQRVLVPLQHQI